MAQYNVTRDIRKLAEEAEKDKIQNPSIQDTSIAGLGLGSAYYANKTGAPKNNPKPTLLQQQIAENDALNRQNAKTEGRTKTSTPRPQPQPQPQPQPKPEPEFKLKNDGSLDMRSKTNRDAVNELDNLGKGKDNVLNNTPPKTDPKVKTKANLLPEFKGMPTGDDFKTLNPVKQAGNVFRAGGSLARGAFDPRTFALFGGYEAGNLIGLDDLGEFVGEKVGDAVMDENLGLANFYANATGGTDPRRPSRFVKGLNFLGDAYNTVTDVAGNIIEGTARLLPETGDYYFSSNPQTDNVFKSAYGKAFDDEGTYLEPENKGMFLNQNQRQRPNPEINTQSVDATVPTQNNVAQENTSIPLEDRSEAELQIMRNQEAGKPLLSSPTGSRDPNLPKFQQNFLRMKEEGKEIDDATFQSAQQFALNRGMVFDPETGFEKAQFFGQMFKGQTIGQFLRGEDAPLGYTDVIPEYNPPGSPGYNSQSSSSMRDSVEKSDFMKKESDFMKDRPDFPEGKMRLSDYKKLARHEGYKGSAVNARAKQMMSEAQSKDQMTPYQKAQLASQQAKSAQASDLAERKFAESVRQYKDTVARGQDKEEIDVMYKQVQTLKLLQDIKKGQEKEPEELGFSLDSNVLEGYVDVLDILGISYDHENPGVYTTKGYMGVGKKQLTSEDLEQVKPLLGQTEFVKLLEYTQKQAQQK